MIGYEDEHVAIYYYIDKSGSYYKRLLKSKFTYYYSELNYFFAIPTKKIQENTTISVLAEYIEHLNSNIGGSEIRLIKLKFQKYHNSMRWMIDDTTPLVYIGN